MSSSPAPFTWLQAAEHVLREEGPEMHIKDLTTRILELGIVKSNCATSLETLLYRQTSGGSQGKGTTRGVAGPSKFIRVAGKHGWFGLKPSVLQEESDLNVSLESVDEILMDDKNISEREAELDSKFYQTTQQLLRRRNSAHSSDEEHNFFLMSSDSSESSDQIDESSEDSPDEDDLDSIVDESLYRKKYTFLKKLAKTIVFENAALADELTGMEDKIKRMEVERKLLFGKLVEFERGGAPKHCIAGVLPYSGFMLKNQPPPEPDHAHRPTLYREEHLAKRTAKQPPVQQASHSRRPKFVSHADIKRSPLHSRKQQRRVLLEASDQSNEEWSDSEGELVIDTLSGSLPKKESSKRRKEPAVEVVAKKSLVEEEACADGEDAELELAMRSGKVRRLHPIPLKHDGSPVFPIVVGGLKVLNLGKIVSDRVAYHSERYLLPVGFESQRTYPSMLDPSKKCSYTCRILDGGEAPLFEMVADDDQKHPIKASSSTACQTIVLKNINKARDKQATNSGSGPEFFGYSNPTILNLLQKMSDAKKCPKYKFVRFAEPSRRGGQRIHGGGKKIHSGGVRKLNPKSKTPMKKVKKLLPVKKKFDPELFGSNKGQKQSPKDNSSSAAIAPVLGTGLEVQYGMDVGALSDSSSDDLSSATDNELIIDS